MYNLSLFDEHFKSKLYEQIKEIEKDSFVEVVVIVRGSSEKYRDVSLWFGYGLQILTVGYMLFSPIVFSPYYICFMGLFSLIFGYLLVQLIHPLKRLLVGKRRMKRAVEIYSRAIFQKGGLYYTTHHNGLLIFVSLFEKEVVLLPDKGLIIKLPEHVWQDLEQEFRSIFSNENLITDALLEKLNDLHKTLSEYLPLKEKKVNEIPDNLEVQL